MKYNLVQLWDKDPFSETLLLETYTDDEGNYSFYFENADDPLQFENGGYDVFVRLMPKGEDVCVYRGDGTCYQADLDYYENILTGANYSITYTFNMKNTDESPSPFGQALQVAQAAIFGSKYYREMKNSDITDVSIRYPHNEEDSGCFYRSSTQTIYIVGSTLSSSYIQPYSYAACDVILHEYAHHISNLEGLRDSPGGGHGINIGMADHYKDHFMGASCAFNCILSEDPTAFLETECKYQGEALAWNEGFATYMSQMIQEYYALELENIAYVNDKNHKKFNSSVSTNIETEIGTTDDCELTIACILYDMYDSDSSTENQDTLHISHQNMWDYLMDSDAKTFNQFYTYLKTNVEPTELNFSLLGKLLTYHNLAPTAPVAENLSFDSPTYSWNWTEISTYYRNKIFKVRFYDNTKELIAETNTTNQTNIEISESIWTTVLNSISTCYVSVVIYENTSPITFYESELMPINKPRPQSTLINTNYTKTLTSGDYFWFVFGVPQTATYIFETTGQTNTVGEIFSGLAVGHNITYRLPNGYNNDQSSENRNFQITYNLEKDQTVYIRVRGVTWTAEGTFTFHVTTPAHNHVYTNHYSTYNNLRHKAHCYCGEFILESHTFQMEGFSSRCRKCGLNYNGFIVADNINPLNKRTYINNDPLIVNKTIYLEEKNKNELF